MVTAMLGRCLCIRDHVRGNRAATGIIRHGCFVRVVVDETPPVEYSARLIDEDWDCSEVRDKGLAARPQPKGLLLFPQY